MNATNNTNIIVNNVAYAVATAFAEKIAAATSGKMADIMKAKEDGRVELINAGRLVANTKSRNPAFGRNADQNKMLEQAKWVSPIEAATVISKQGELFSFNREGGIPVSGAVFCQARKAIAIGGAYVYVNQAVGYLYLQPALAQAIVDKWDSKGTGLTKERLAKALCNGAGYLFRIEEHQFVTVVDTVGVTKTLTTEEYLDEFGVNILAKSPIDDLTETSTLFKLSSQDSGYECIQMRISVAREVKEFHLDKSRATKQAIVFATTASRVALNKYDGNKDKVQGFTQLCDFLGVKAPASRQMNALVIRHHRLAAKHLVVATEGRTHHAAITNTTLLLAAAIGAAGSTSVATVFEHAENNPGIRYIIELKGVDQNRLADMMDLGQDFIPEESLFNNSPNINEKLAQIGAVSIHARNSFAACYYPGGLVYSAFDALKSIARFKLNLQSGYELGNYRVAFITGLFDIDQNTGEYVPHGIMKEAEKVRRTFEGRKEAGVISAYKAMVGKLDKSPVAKMLATGAGHACDKFVLNFGVVRITSENAMIKSVVTTLGDRFNKLCKDLGVDFVLPTPKAGAFGIGYLLAKENGMKLSQSEYMYRVRHDAEFCEKLNDLIEQNTQYIPTPEGEIMQIITTSEDIIGKNFYNLEGFYLTKRGRALYEKQHGEGSAAATDSEMTNAMLDYIVLDDDWADEEEIDNNAGDDDDVEAIDTSIIKWALRNLYTERGTSPIVNVYALMKAGYIARRKKVSTMNIQALQALHQVAGADATQQFIDYCVSQARDVTLGITKDTCDVHVSNIADMLTNTGYGLFRNIKHRIGGINAEAFNEWQGDNGVAYFNMFVEEYLHGVFDKHGNKIEEAWPGVNNIKRGICFTQYAGNDSYDYVITPTMLKFNEEVAMNDGEIFAPDGLKALQSIAMMHIFAVDNEGKKDAPNAFANAHVTWANYLLNMSKAMFGKGTFEVKLPGSANLAAVPNLYDNKVRTAYEGVSNQHYVGIIKYPTVLENSVRFFVRDNPSVRLDEALFGGMPKEASIELSNFIFSRVIEVPVLSHLNNQDDIDGDRLSIFRTNFTAEQNKYLAYSPEKMAEEYSVVSRAIKMAGEVSILGGIGRISCDSVKEISKNEWHMAAKAFAQSKSDTGVFTNGLISVTHMLMSAVNAKSEKLSPAVVAKRKEVGLDTTYALTQDEADFLVAMLGEGLQKGAIAAMKDSNSFSDIAIVLNRVDGRASSAQGEEIVAIHRMIGDMAFSKLKAKMTENYDESLLVITFQNLMEQFYTKQKVRPTLVGKVNAREWDDELGKYVALTPSIMDVAMKNEIGKDPVHLFNSVRLAQGSYYKNVVGKVFNAKDFKQNARQYFDQFLPAYVVLSNKRLFNITKNAMVKVDKEGKITRVKTFNIMGMVEVSKVRYAEQRLAEYGIHGIKVEGKEEEAAQPQRAVVGL